MSWCCCCWQSSRVSRFARSLAAPTGVDGAIIACRTHTTTSDDDVRRSLIIYFKRRGAGVALACVERRFTRPDRRPHGRTLIQHDAKAKPKRCRFAASVESVVYVLMCVCVCDNGVHCTLLFACWTRDVALVSYCARVYAH